MRLKASFVVENAVIAPLFTLIIVALMSLCLYIRDSLIVKNGILIASMKAEQEVRKKDGTDNSVDNKAVCMEDVISSAQDYIQDNIVVMKNIDTAQIKNEMKKKRIADNYPPDFIRMVNVIKKRL